MAGQANFKINCSAKQDEIRARVYDVHCQFEDYDIIKWHNMHNNMIMISKEFPKVLITISRHSDEGSLFDEDSDTFYKHYYKNGKSKTIRGKVVYPEFNELELE